MQVKITALKTLPAIKHLKGCYGNSQDSTGSRSVFFLKRCFRKGHHLPYHCSSVMSPDKLSPLSHRRENQPRILADRASSFLVQQSQLCIGHCRSDPATFWSGFSLQYIPLTPCADILRRFQQVCARQRFYATLLIPAGFLPDLSTSQLWQH